MLPTVRKLFTAKNATRRRCINLTQFRDREIVLENYIYVKV